MSFWLMALRASGRLSVTMATFSATSTVKHSYRAYLDIFFSLSLVRGDTDVGRRPNTSLAAYARLDLGHGNMKRHGPRILLQHLLNGFQMRPHQPRRSGNVPCAQRRQELPPLFGKPRRRGT